MIGIGDEQITQEGTIRIFPNNFELQLRGKGQSLLELICQAVTHYNSDACESRLLFEFGRSLLMMDGHRAAEDSLVRVSHCTVSGLVIHRSHCWRPEITVLVTHHCHAHLRAQPMRGPG